MMDLGELERRLDVLKDKIVSLDKTTQNRFFITCESERGAEVCRFLFEELGCRFVIATVIDSDHYFEILYHFSYDQLGVVITVKSLVRDKEHPSVESISAFLPGAQWIEREIHDVAGIEFRGHPDMRRLVLADDWPEGVYPLRKEAKR